MDPSEFNIGPAKFRHQSPFGTGLSAVESPSVATNHHGAPPTSVGGYAESNGVFWATTIRTVRERRFFTQAVLLFRAGGQAIKNSDVYVLSGEVLRVVTLDQLIQAVCFNSDKKSIDMMWLPSPMSSVNYVHGTCRSGDFEGGKRLQVSFINSWKPYGTLQAGISPIGESRSSQTISVSLDQESKIVNYFGKARDGDEIGLVLYIRDYGKKCTSDPSTPDVRLHIVPVAIPAGSNISDHPCFESVFRAECEVVHYYAIGVVKGPVASSWYITDGLYLPYIAYRGPCLSGYRMPITKSTRECPGYNGNAILTISLHPKKDWIPV